MTILIVVIWLVIALVINTFWAGLCERFNSNPWHTDGESFGGDDRTIIMIMSVAWPASIPVVALMRTANFLARLLARIIK